MSRWNILTSYKWGDLDIIEHNDINDLMNEIFNIEEDLGIKLLEERRFIHKKILDLKENENISFEFDDNITWIMVQRMN